MTAFNNRGFWTEYSTVYSQMKGCGEPRNLDNFAVGKPRNYANWPAEFGKIFHGKLWDREISKVQSETHLAAPAFHLDQESLELRVYHAILASP